MEAGIRFGNGLSFFSFSFFISSCNASFSFDLVLVLNTAITKITRTVRYLRDLPEVGRVEPQWRSTDHSVHYCNAQSPFSSLYDHFVIIVITKMYQRVPRNADFTKLRFVNGLNWVSSFKTSFFFVFKFYLKVLVLVFILSYDEYFSVLFSFSLQGEFSFSFGFRRGKQHYHEASSAVTGGAERRWADRPGTGSIASPLLTSVHLSMRRGARNTLHPLCIWYSPAGRSARFINLIYCCRQMVPCRCCQHSMSTSTSSAEPVPVAMELKCR